ncbi:MAG: type II toxin-antitoxin system RelE/ParE family toxin [Actinomycetota bacterium]|nr:type II toxin-antitoxin system RelE/ParE family toxin [Actinomycetota bacterium]
MEYNIVYKSSIKKDLRRIDKKKLPAILEDIESVLKDSPLKGKELKSEFEGLFSYRVGDYRVIYTILGNTVMVLRISHRKDAYK